MSLSSLISSKANEFAVFGPTCCYAVGLRIGYPTLASRTAVSFGPNAFLQYLDNLASCKLVELLIRSIDLAYLFRRLEAEIVWMLCCASPRLANQLPCRVHFVGCGRELIDDRRCSRAFPASTTDNRHPPTNRPRRPSYPL